VVGGRESVVYTLANLKGAYTNYIKYLFLMRYEQKTKEIKKKSNSPPLQDRALAERVVAKTSQLKSLISGDPSRDHSRDDVRFGLATETQGRKVGGNRKLVGLGFGQSSKIRPDITSSSARAPGTSLSRLSQYTVNGLRTQVATRHASLASYNKAVSNDMSVALNEGSTFRGARHQEFEYMRGADHHIRVSGREFLVSLATTANALAVGDRFASGIAMLDPRGIGGRIQYFSESYAQHKFLRCKICYEPVAPATEAGAIFVYFAPDVGEQTFVRSTELLQHASTFPCFMQTPVWQAAEMDISPQDAFTRYFDSTVGEFRTETQGIITAAAASALDANTAFGSLYIEYDVDFYSPELDFELQFRAGGNLTLTFSAVTGAMLAGQSVLCVASGIAAGYGAFTLTGVTNDIGLVDYLFYGVVYNSTADFTVDAIGNKSLIIPFTGMGAWFRFWTTGATVATAFYPSLLSASQDEGGPQAYNPDLMAYYSPAYTFVGAITIQFAGFWYLIR